MKFWYSEHKQFVYWVLILFFGSYALAGAALWAFFLIGGNAALTPPFDVISVFLEMHPLGKIVSVFWCVDGAYLQCTIGLKIRSFTFFQQQISR